MALNKCTGTAATPDIVTPIAKDSVSVSSLMSVITSVKSRGSRKNLLPSSILSELLATVHLLPKHLKCLEQESFGKP